MAEDGNVLPAGATTHRWDSAAGLVKVVAALGFWVWLGVWWYLRREVDTQAQVIVVVVAVLFILPHLVTISAPRYRIPMDVLCFASAAEMLCSRYRTSVPLPAR